MAETFETNMPSYRWPLVARMDTFLRNSSIYLKVKYYLRKVFEWNLLGIGKIIMICYFGVSIVLAVGSIFSTAYAFFATILSYGLVTTAILIPMFLIYFFISWLPFLLLLSVHRDWELGVFDEQIDAKRFRKRIFIAGNKPLNYYDYIQTIEWREKRKQKLREADYKCEECRKFGVPLQVHHLNYDRLGNEEISDLMVLCKKCHLKYELEKENKKQQ